MIEDKDKRTSSEQSQTDAFFKTLVENTLDVITIIDGSGQILYESRSVQRILGYSPSELIGKNIFDYIHPEDIQSVADSLGNMRVIDYTPEIIGLEKEIETRIRHRDGTWKIFESMTLNLKIPPIKGIVIHSRDITERKETETFLSRKKLELDSFFNMSSDLLIISDIQISYRRLNPSWEKTLGYSMEDFESRSLFEFIHPDDVSNTRRAVEALAATGTVSHFINRFRCKDGSYRWFEWRAGTSGDLIFAIARDITDRKIIEDNLKESEERYRITLKTMPDAVSIMRCDDLQYLYANDTFCRTMGYTWDELEGKSPYDLDLPVSPEDRENLQKCITDKGETAGQRFRLRTKDGSILETVTSCSPLMYGGHESMIVVVTDVTPLKKAEEEAKLLETQLAQAQKMEALGSLAGGIAHDFNNILAAIIGYTELAMYQSKSQEKVQKNLSQVLKSSKRARDLVSQILAFSQQSEKKYTPLMLGYIIKETLKMLRSVLPANIEIRQNLVVPGLVLADATQIHQMMMNLSSNAVQAMGENGGVLEVNLEQVILDETTAHGLDLTPGPYQRVMVSDTGHGIAPEIIPHIFEPYYTTRDIGKGTGLGLSIVHSIVIRHRGAIICRSEPGKGTVFEIFLPEIESAIGKGEPIEELEMPVGHESILFIDDEPALDEIAKNILEGLGYRVTTTARSNEALGLFTAYPDRFDLVVTDMTMPDITGDKLAKKLLSIRKDIPIILCTGYSEHITEEKARKIGIREMLMKPLEIKELAHTIRKVLDQQSSS